MMHDLSLHGSGNAFFGQDFFFNISQESPGIIVGNGREVDKNVTI